MHDKNIDQGQVGIVKHLQDFLYFSFSLSNLSSVASGLTPSNIFVIYEATLLKQYSNRYYICFFLSKRLLT